jgi:diketogulonate reductase-like aldo/keto reductase
MQIPTKKLKNGFEMSVFGIGTWLMGGGNEKNVRSEAGGDDAGDIAAIKAAIDLGVTHIDTAEVYAEGHAEELVAEAIKNYDRKKLFLVSKVKAASLNSNGIKTSIKSSLQRLGTNYLDLYLMHRCPAADKFEECVLAMNELVDQGLVKHIGLSNTNNEHTKILCSLSKYPFVVNQVHYNLQFREPQQDGLLDFCQKNDMFLEAWRPVNKGALAKPGNYNITKQGLPLLDEMCKKYSKTPAQIAINWLISQENVITLAKSSNVEHLKENLGAIGWQMEPADIELLLKEFPDQKFISDVVPLG